MTLIKKIPVGIIGSGNIGTDLLKKISRSKYLECVAFIGRNVRSPGMQIAASMGVNVSSESLSYIEKNPNLCRIIFDATSAEAHQLHAEILKDLSIKTIDLTPAKVGLMCVPSVNIEDCLNAWNVNVITCGGQASIPIANAISLVHPNPEYIEVVSTIASRSAGKATRQNLDEYIHTTEAGISYFSGAKNVKVILNLNPADPCIDMQTTVFAKVKNPNITKLKFVLDEIILKIKSYVPEYNLILGPILDNDRIVVMVKVKGLGDYLPSYAGNLDIINCAAVAMAEKWAEKWA